MSDIRAFTLSVAEDELVALADRLDRVRWPEQEPVADWSQGTKLTVLRELVAYWRIEYDWRRCEARLNALGQFKTEIDGLDIHFLHRRSSRAGAVPLLLTHGWPGSVVEFFGVIDDLVEPEDPDAMAFHVIAPSLPGYGFSDKPARSGCGKWNCRMRRSSPCGASAMSALMRSICFCLLLAWVALVFLERNRSTNLMSRSISFCWFS